MGHLRQEDMIASLKKQLDLLETEYKLLQANTELLKICALRHKIKQVQEKLRNCKWNGGSSNYISSTN